MGDLGGIIEIIMMVSQLALSGLSEHSFLLKAIEKLYMVKTAEKSLFTPSRKQTKKLKKIQNPKHVSALPPANQKDILMNKPIKFSLKQRASLYFRSICSACCWRSKANAKEWKIYNEGAEKIEKEMNIVRIIRSIRFSKVLFKRKLVSEEGMVEIHNAVENTIAIDSNPDDQSKQVIELASIEGLPSQTSMISSLNYSKPMRSLAKEDPF